MSVWVETGLSNNITYWCSLLWLPWRAFVCVSMCVCVMSPTSLPYIMRWWVVIRALKTTTQLELAVRSNSVSASWGMFTFISLVQWIRSGQDTKKNKKKTNNKMREEEKLTQDNRTKSSDEKLLKITLTDTMPNYFSHREKKNADTQQGPTNRARISSEFLSERSLKDRCYPQNYFLSSFDSYSAAPLPSSLLSTS